MLFNSYEFIFLFFPFCVFGYFVCTRFFSLETALGFLVFASLVFYAYWKPIFLVLLIFSIGFNFLIGRLLSRGDGRGRLFFVVFGVAGNIALLAYFKYANFFFDNIDAMLDTQWNIGNVFLPLAISFFTLQQISYLVDAYRGETREYSFLRYSLFVCFFPQLFFCAYFFFCCRWHNWQHWLIFIAFRVSGGALCVNLMATRTAIELVNDKERSRVENSA